MGEQDHKKTAGSLFDQFSKLLDRFSILEVIFIAIGIVILLAFVGERLTYWSNFYLNRF